MELKELIGKNCKIVGLKTFRTADEEVIYGLIIEINGRRIEIVADDPAGCFNGGGYCLPMLRLSSDE